jgi:predicted nucleic acid-binding protein
MNNVKVIDASALGAILFAEPEADAVEQRLSGALLIAELVTLDKRLNTAFPSDIGKALFARPYLPPAAAR